MLWRKEEGEHTKEVNKKGAYLFFMGTFANALFFVEESRRLCRKR